MKRLAALARDGGLETPRVSGRQPIGSHLDSPHHRNRAASILHADVGDFEEDLCVLAALQGVLERLVKLGGELVLCVGGVELAGADQLGDALQQRRHLFPVLLHPAPDVEALDLEGVGGER